MEKYSWKAMPCNAMVTGRVSFVLEDADSVTPRTLFSVIKYDHRARPARMETENLLGGYDVEDTEHDFQGRVTKRHVLHHASLLTNDLEEEYSYAYDHAGRLLTVGHTVNGGESRVLADNQYDELGRLKVNKANGGEALVTAYDYNLRSWLTKVTSPAFEEELLYNESDGTAKPLYGGNVSSMNWKAGNDGGSRRYGFTYDGLGRLTAATYGEKATSGKKPGKGGGNYDTRYAYDKMGNIQSLRRQGLHDDGACDVIDDLKYTYDGNKVIRVEDSAIDPVYKDCFTFVDGAEDETEYEYDGNGNLAKDLNRGICGIEYNCLNLPSEVDFTDGSRITYTYDGGGRKLRTDYYMNPLTMSVPQLSGGTGTAGEDALVHTWTDYCANKVYENDTLRMSLFDGGYVSYDAKADASSPSPSYHYYIKDHLGNNRVVLGENGEVEQVNHYYPFGGLMGESKSLASSQRYKYNGKELDRTHGLDWYDYGARMYDPALARWMAPDPLAEKYYGVSPYAYCGDNPINAMDPDGQDFYYSKNGHFLFQDKKTTNFIYVDDKKLMYKNRAVTYDQFIKLSSTVYAESSVVYGITNREEMYAIASVHLRNSKAYGANNVQAKRMRNTDLSNLTETMEMANAAVINALQGGHDYSNGADQWDGAEQAMVKKEYQNKPSDGRIMYKMNTMGWSMNIIHYNSWKSAIERKFGMNKFTVPRIKRATSNYKGMFNKNKIRLHSTAQYGLTIFWKTN